MKRNSAILIIVLFAIATPARAEVVINEIFYHAPHDFDDLQWIELHNPGSQPADISQWQLTGKVAYRFGDNCLLGPGEFVVLCKDKQLFSEFYESKVAGEFQKSLARDGGTLTLVDSTGKVVDQVKYRDRDPWPAAADGISSSLERITPAASGDRPDNWSASPLPDDEERPAGTPGTKNASYSPNFPPIIRELRVTPSNPQPQQPIRVQAIVEDDDGITTVELRYSIAGPGEIGEEKLLVMTATDGKNFSGEIPGCDRARLVRIRVRAVDQKKSERFLPAANELRPTLSLYIHDPSETAAIPLAYMISTDARELKEMERLRRRSNQPSLGNFGDPDLQQLQQLLTVGLNLPDIWFEWTVNRTVDHATYHKLREVFLARNPDRNQIIEDALGAENAAMELKELPAKIKAFQDSFAAQVSAVLPAGSAEEFRSWYKQHTEPREPNPVDFVKRMVNVEGTWFGVHSRAAFTAEQMEGLIPHLKEAISGRADAAQKIVRREIASFDEFRATIGAIESKLEKEMQQRMTLRQRRAVQEWRAAQGSPIRPRLTDARARSPRGKTAFIVVQPQSDDRAAAVEVFDYLHITERSAGYKVRFHKDHTWNGMTSAAVIFEYNDRFVLAEPLAYELYRRAGNAACQTDFVRLTANEHLLGYHLVIEQVNGAFLRRNRLSPDGDLFKILWYASGIENQHEKQNHPDHNHAALVQLVESLNSTTADEQWDLIARHFHVDQVINYFAVNLLLSHWDGFFNNYFTYQDPQDGKWEMYPWDQDKTWGFHDASADKVFFDMPVTFGMAGDLPPGGGNAGFNPGSWWRPGGYFSAPLLANPEFRKRYLLRVRQLLEETYTEKDFFPAIEALAERLKPEVTIRAKALGEKPSRAIARLDKNVASLKEHLVKRREFLLQQQEIADLPR